VKVYLAARYSRREELCGYAAELRAAGFEITSRWLDGDHQISDGGLSEQAHAQERQRFAEEDWTDLMAAEVTISFTEEPRGTNSRGGRHVEFGAAMALGQYCIVCGPAENVFHHLPEVFLCEYWAAAFNDVFGYREMWNIANRMEAVPKP
jgi:hypothetical protein